MATQIASPRPLPTASPPSAIAQIGHNRPPLDVEAVADMGERIDERSFGPNSDMTFAEWSTALLGSASRASATDQESAGKCADLERKIGAAIKHVAEAHVEAKAPYLAAGRAVDEYKNRLSGPLMTAKAAVNGQCTQFLREENARRDAELRRQREAQAAIDRTERERIAAEEAAQAPQAAQEPKRDAFGLLPPLPEPISAVAPLAAPEPLQFRSDEGALLSGSRVWIATVVDYELAFMAVANNSKVREAIDKAIAAIVKSGVHEMPGVRIVRDVKARSL